MIFNWNRCFTIVAGADLSAAQYKSINWAGTLASSSTNGAGIIQNKPQTGEHVTVCKVGATKALVGETVAVGDHVGFSDASSGWLSKVTSGVICGEVMQAANSGYLAEVYLLGGPGFVM